MKGLAVTRLAGIALAATLLAPSAQAQVAARPTGEQSLRGSIEVVDPTYRMIRIAGKDLFGVKDTDLQRLRPGQEVDAKYIVDANGQLRLLSITGTPRGG